MIAPLFAALDATSLAFGSVSAIQASNQNGMALANGVTGRETMGQVAALGSIDRFMALQGAAAQSNYLAAIAMQEGAGTLQKKNSEQRARMIANGALFV